MSFPLVTFFALSCAAGGFICGRAFIADRAAKQRRFRFVIALLTASETALFCAAVARSATSALYYGRAGAACIALCAAAGVLSGFFAGGSCKK